MTSKVLKIVVEDQTVLIDRRDLKGLDLSTLSINKDSYAMLGSKLLHRVIMNPPLDLQIDHKNKDTLDNRRSNLRICTHSQNQMNRGKTRANTAGYKGVNLDKRRKRKKYRVRITANRKTHYLGSFEKPDDAGAAYKKAIKKHHGKFARDKDPEKQKEL
jgi:hypothetical protein